MKEIQTVSHEETSKQLSVFEYRKQEIQSDVGLSNLYSSMKLKSMFFLFLCFSIISIYTIILFDFNNSITLNSSSTPTFHSRLSRPFHHSSIFKNKGGNI